MTPTPAGELVLGWARLILTERHEIFAIARAIHKGEVPPLRMGFSSFVNPSLLTLFHQAYSDLFPKCEVAVSGTDSAIILQRLTNCHLDCAILPCPIDSKLMDVIPIAQSKLVVCMRSDDSLALQREVNIHEVGRRITVFRDPDLHPSAHAHLVELFASVGVSMVVGNSGSNKGDVQWMVREKYGLALIEESLALEAGLTTRLMRGVNWSVETAFVANKNAEHMALPFVQRFLRQEGITARRKGPHGVRQQARQLKAV